VIFALGPNGIALVRVAHDRAADTLVCTLLNSGAQQTIQRDTDANLVAGLKLLASAIAAVTGPPSIVTDLSELL